MIFISACGESSDELEALQIELAETKAEVEQLKANDIESTSPEKNFYSLTIEEKEFLLNSCESFGVMSFNHCFVALDSVIEWFSSPLMTGKCKNNMLLHYQDWFRGLTTGERWHYQPCSGEYSVEDLKIVCAYNEMEALNCKDVSTLDYFDFTNIENSVLNEANFSNADLTGAIFSGKVLTNTNFKNSILVNADFLQTQLSNIDFEGANATGINFSFSTVRKGNFVDIDLSSSNLDDVVWEEVQGVCKEITPKFFGTPYQYLNRNLWEGENNRPSLTRALINSETDLTGVCGRARRD